MNPNLYHDEKGDSVFDELHIWTGSAKLDVNLERVKRWAEDFLKQDPEKNPAIHNGFKQDEVRDVIEKQRKEVRKARREGNEFHKFYVLSTILPMTRGQWDAS